MAARRRAARHQAARRATNAKRCAAADHRTAGIARRPDDRRADAAGFGSSAAAAAGPVRPVASAGERFRCSSMESCPPRPGCAGRKGRPGRPAEAVLETRRHCHAAERPAFCAGTGRGRPDLGSDMAGQRPAASRAGACGEHALTRALHVEERDSHRARARAAAKTARVAPTLAHARTRRPTITRPRDSATNVRLRARTDDSDSGALARERRRAPTRARTRVDKRQRGAIRRPSIRHRIGRGRQWGSSGVTERGSPDPMSRNRKSRNRIHSGVRLPCCHRQLHSPMHG